MLVELHSQSTYLGMLYEHLPCRGFHGLDSSAENSIHPGTASNSQSYNVFVVIGSVPSTRCPPSVIFDGRCAKLATSYPLLRRQFSPVLTSMYKSKGILYKCHGLVILKHREVPKTSIRAPAMQR